jgi:hypothetical protein
MLLLTLRLLEKLHLVFRHPLLGSSLKNLSPIVIAFIVGIYLHQVRVVLVERSYLIGLYELSVTTDFIRVLITEVVVRMAVQKLLIDLEFLIQGLLDLFMEGLLECNLPKYDSFSLRLLIYDRSILLRWLTLNFLGF